MQVNEPGWLLPILEWASALFVVFVAVVILVVIVLYVLDITQTTHAIRRNYPVIGRFRYLFESLGEFFRQYFFAMDREELPFNRAERSWAYRAAKDVDNTVAFGSTRDLRPVGTVMFMNAPFAPLDQEIATADSVTIGPGARYPFTTESFFNISAMSYGAISKPAVLALSRGAKMAGCWLNTGEGGLSPYHLEGGCDLVFQIGTAKYGVGDGHGSYDEARLRAAGAHEQVRMFELKLSQGAKPGKGGILPEGKVTQEISNIRAIPIGEASISPNRHPEIASVDDLLDVIAYIRETTGKPVGFKSVLGDPRWMDELCDAIHRRGVDMAPDFITVDSADGGTGAAPMPLIDAMGLPLRESLPAVVDALVAWDLRDRIKVMASGKLINPTPVAWSLCMGADFINSARGFMFSLGCIQALQCNRNTCPTGITTHDLQLQRGLDVTDKAQRVKHYHQHMCHEVGMIAHSCGVHSPRHLDRRHARIVGADGRSLPLDELYPNATPGSSSLVRGSGSPMRASSRLSAS
jgi:glutamate synthase domain-containing protein 2